MPEELIKLAVAIPTVIAVIYALNASSTKHLNHIEKTVNDHKEALKSTCSDHREDMVAAREAHKDALIRVCESHEKCSEKLGSKMGQVEAKIDILADHVRKD